MFDIGPGAFRECYTEFSQLRLKGQTIVLAGEEVPSPRFFPHQCSLRGMARTFGYSTVRVETMV